jgi:hypothetical protein
MSAESVVDALMGCMPSSSRKDLGAILNSWVRCWMTVRDGFVSKRVYS